MYCLLYRITSACCLGLNGANTWYICEVEELYLKKMVKVFSKL